MFRESEIRISRGTNIADRKTNVIRSVDLYRDGCGTSGESVFSFRILDHIRRFLVLMSHYVRPACRHRRVCVFISGYLGFSEMKKSS